MNSISRLAHAVWMKNYLVIFPAKHYLVAKDVCKKAVKSIKKAQHLPKLAELEKSKG